MLILFPLDIRSFDWRLSDIKSHIASSFFFFLKTAFFSTLFSCFKGKKTATKAPLYVSSQLPNGPAVEGWKNFPAFPVQPSSGRALVFTVNKLYHPLKANGAVDWCLLITAGSGVWYQGLLCIDECGLLVGGMLAEGQGMGVRFVRSLWLGGMTDCVYLAFLASPPGPMQSLLK